MRIRRTIYVASVVLFFVAATARAQSCVNINTATKDELMELPHIGRVLAERIIKHREKHGPFKRPQDLVVIRGLSAKYYREIAPRLCPIH
jgi:competence protein ComEA